jgi:phage terminase small subunit
MKELTDKQKRFCEEYLIDLNATQAAIRAGYSQKTAHSIGAENLIKPEVQEHVALLQKERSERVQVSADWVLRRFKDISDRCFQAEPVMVMKNGQLIESGEYKFDSSGANKATELIAKHIGFFATDNDQKSNRKIIVNTPDE